MCDRSQRRRMMPIGDFYHSQSCIIMSGSQPDRAADMPTLAGYHAAFIPIGTISGLTELLSLVLRHDLL